MSSSTLKKDVEIEGRFVQLEVGSNGQTEESNSFYVGLWEWKISVFRANKCTWVTLSPCTKIDSGTASVSVKLTFFPKGPPLLVQKIREVEAPLNRDSNWTLMDGYVSRSCLVEIEFVSMNMLGRTDSALLSLPMQWTSQEQAQSSVARMLREGILTDITINAMGGSIRAHRAVLAARSPVFLSMFSHDLREKEHSTVDISDMSIAACRAFIRYLYSASGSEEELLAHRSELVVASDKYCIADMKMTCEASLREDVCTENVLHRLQMAHVYSLRALKRTCIRLLVDFGKMYEIPEDFLEFMKDGDPELVGEIKLFAVSQGKKFPATPRESSGKSSAKKAPVKRARKPTPSKSAPPQTSASIPSKRPSQSSIWKPMSGQDSQALPNKRARRANVRFAGDEWALSGSEGTP